MVDLVVHEKVDDSSIKVKEITRSTRDLCGGTFIDKAFSNYLDGKIGCLKKFLADYPATLLTLTGYWEELKWNCSGQSDPYDLDLPAKLANAWEAHEKTNGTWCEDSHYDAITITDNDMKMIFDGEVNKILNLIKDQLGLAPGVEAIMVVRGFSNSPYIMKMIRKTFSSAVKHIISPADPRSAICQAAIAFGALGVDIMMSRKSRQTYGIRLLRAFKKGDPPDSLVINDSREAQCSNSFSVFTRIGDDVPVNHHVANKYGLVYWKTAKAIRFTMYSTTVLNPNTLQTLGSSRLVPGYTLFLPRR